MGIQSPAAESEIVVTDANRSKVSVDAVDWAIKRVVQPKDMVIVLGVFSEAGKKSSSSCLPFNMCISLSGISVRIEFSGHGEMSPTELEEEIEKKREEYQCTFHPFYRRCKKNQVKLEVKLAAGYDPRQITIEEAQNCNPRWIVLDSHFKKHKEYIYGRVACKVAVMKGKDFASLMPSRAPNYNHWPTDCESIGDVGFTASYEHDKPHQQDEEEDLNSLQNNKTLMPAAPTTQSPSWYPLSWRTGFPRAFSTSELELITNGFANENLVVEEDEMKIYEGVYQETPVLIKLFSANDDRFWSVLKVLSRVRHRNILNLVGYCCSDSSLFLLCDYPSSGTVEMNLLCEESAKSLSWTVRWYIALEIGIGLRYLHEECVDGPIADLSVSSTYVVFSQGSTAMLCIFNTAKWLKDDIPITEDSPAEYLNTEEDKLLLADVYDYGMFLIELITGKSARYFQEQGEGQSLIDWAVPFLENGSLNQVMDPRVMEAGDAGVVFHMARAALLCLKNDAGRKVSISEALAVVRGDQFAVTASS